MKAQFLIVLVAISLQLSCNKDDEDELPLITEIGANTFGCYANGILITPRDGSGTFNQQDRGMRLVGSSSPEILNYREIRVHDFASFKTSRITIHFVELDTLGVKDYIVNESNCIEGFFSVNTNNITCRIWDSSINKYNTFCSIENSGMINVTRYDNGILSGTFYCQAAAIEDSTNIIEITHGRFDINGSSLPQTHFP